MPVAGVAVEILLTIAGAIVLLPLALVVLKALDSLDADNGKATAEGKPSEPRPWNRRVGSAVVWIALGCLPPAVVGLYFARVEVWAGLVLYLGCNLGGTLVALGEFELRPRAARAVKALFVFQVPTGVLFLLANGL